MKPNNLPTIALIGASADKDFIGKFNAHSYQLKASQYNQWKGYDFRYLNLGSEAGTDAAAEAEEVLARCTLVIVFISVDIMDEDSLYALVGRAITVSKEREINTLGIQVRADLGSERDLWKRLNGILIHKDKPISEHREHHEDSAWCEIIGMLRRWLPPIK